MKEKLEKKKRKQRKYKRTVKGTGMLEQRVKS